MSVDRHLYLLAKGHYDKSLPLWWKLACVIAHWLGEDPHNLSKNTILRHLIHQLNDNLSIKMKKSPSYFYGVFEDTLGIGSFGYRKIDDVHTRFAWRCLSELALTKIVDIPVALGKPDPTILPLHRKES